VRFANIAFYKFVDFPRFAGLREEFRGRCRTLEGLKGTILLTPEGVNGFLAGPETAVNDFQDWIRSIPEFKDLTFKTSYSDQNPFKRMLVKLKREIIPLGDATIQPAVRTGERISAKELKTWLDENRDFVLLDTRNKYEIDHGTFEKAVDLDLQHFRTFPNAIKKIPDELKSKPMVMFCTGGIRCEKASVIALMEGFKSVYQLDGGILKYLEECGNTHYKGKCFVFDHRESIGPDEINTD
jgi:UPF0176 protein